jgi:hypothetical protein
VPFPHEALCLRFMEKLARDGSQARADCLRAKRREAVAENDRAQADVQPQNSKARCSRSENYLAPSDLAKTAPSETVSWLTNARLRFRTGATSLVQVGNDGASRRLARMVWEHRKSCTAQIQTQLL